MNLRTSGTVAAACLLSFALSAVEETNDWFAVDMSGYADEVDVSTIENWTGGPNLGIVRADGSAKVVEFNTDEDLLTYTPGTASAADKKTLIKLRVKFSACDSIDAIGEFIGAQAAMSIVKNGPTNTYVGLSDGSWVAITNSSVALPSDTVYTDVAIALDYCADPQTVTYFVKEGNEYKPLGTWPDGSTVKLPLSTSAAGISAVAFAGCGCVTSEFAGKNVTKPYEFKVSGTDSELKVDYSWAVTEIDGFASKSVEQRTAALQANGDNGMPVWQSFVLGLDSTSTPLVVDGVQTIDKGALRIKVADPAQGSGVTVRYQLQKKDGESWGNVGEPSSSNFFDIDLTSNPTGNYRIVSIIE